MTLQGHLGTTEAFTTTPFDLGLSSVALVDLAKSILVHSLILSSHLFFCLPFLFFHSLCPVELPLLNQKTLETWPNHLYFVSWPWLGLHHILQQCLGSFCEPPHCLYGIVQQDSNSIPTGIITGFLAWILALKFFSGFCMWTFHYNLKFPTGVQQDSLWNCMWNVCI